MSDKLKAFMLFNDLNKLCQELIDATIDADRLVLSIEFYEGEVLVLGPVGRDFVKKREVA